MGSAMDEEAFIASVAQFLKKENEDRARHFEEQRLHSQNLERQMMEMKELLLNMAKGQQEAASAPRSPTSPLNEQSESVDDYLGRFECAHQVIDKMSEPKESHNLELSDEEKLKCDELVHRDVEPSQILVENEPKSAKESSVLIAHQLLDKMPQPTKTIEVDLIDELTKDVNVDDSLEIASCIQEDFEPPIVVDEVFSQLKEIYQAAAQGTHTSYAEHVLEVAAAQGKLGLGCIEILCFDPGGGSLPLVDNSLRLELGGGVMFFVSNLSYTEEMSEMQKSFEASLFGIIMNSSVPFASEYDQAKKTDTGLLNLVLETDMFCSVACFETFCFDPGGNYAGVLLERHIVEYELSKCVAWELVEMEPENSAHYVVLSNLYADMGRWADVSKVRGLMEEKALMKAFEVYTGKSLLQPEHMTAVRFFSKNPSPQASKGDAEGNIFLEVKKKFETAMGIIRTEKITIDPNDPASVQQWKGFITRTIFLLILEDKDRLKEGVLLQD